MEEAGLEFVETPIFTRQITEMLDDEEYRTMQNELIKNPKMGNVIPHTRNLRKLRWAANGHGKRGGMRVIYYYMISAERIHFLYAYAKNKQTDMTNEQAKILNAIVQEIEHGR